MKQIISADGGFTLVELIVVIAVLAILAGAVVPAYSGYIVRAGDTAAEAELEAVRTAALNAAVLQGATLCRITVTAEGIVTAYTASGYGPDGVTVSSWAPLELLGLHEGVVRGIGGHSQYGGGCTWTAEDDCWVSGVEPVPSDPS